MKPLREHARGIALALLGARPAVLALDYDGTLTEIVAEPDAACLAEERRSILRRLADVEGLHVAVLSGRSLRDTAARVRVPGVTLVGNHGLEIEDWSLPAADRARGALEAFLRDLSTRPLDRPVLLEDKGATATIHLRGTRAERDRDALLEALQGRLGDSPDASRLRLHRGKASVEVRPAVDWDKARALLLLLERWGGVARDVFYAGDDLTDECVFRELADAVTVKVGEGPTAARYVASDPAEIYAFLQEILALRGEPSPG